MVINTVKAAPPKGYKAKRYMNAGMVSDLASYYRAEENEQIAAIVNGLLEATKAMSYKDGVIHIYPFVEESQNTKEIKARIFKRYCEQKINQ